MLNPLDIFRRRLTPEIWNGLEELGDLEWVRMEKSRTEGKHYTALLEFGDPRIQLKARRNPNVETILRSCCNLGNVATAALTWIELYSMSRIIRFGPKIIVPTVDQCHMMKDVEITVRLERYRQPFRPVVVQYPDEWVQWLKAETGSTILYTLVDMQPYLPSIHLTHATAEDLESLGYMIGSHHGQTHEHLSKLS
jgi:hypothetical protein